MLFRKASNLISGGIYVNPSISNASNGFITSELGIRASLLSGKFVLLDSDF
jgi:hypothetical protein